MTDLEIRYFLEIVNQGVSFNKASQALYISQPALTKHINVLSNELGVKLFDTEKKTAARLTPAGKLYYEFFSDCRDKFKKISQEAKELAGQKSGEIRIICLTGWDMMAGLPAKEMFCEKYPNISIKIFSGSFKAIKSGILNNQYDLAVTFTDQFNGLSNICIHEHYRIPCIILYSSRHRLAGAENLTITDFKDDIFFTLSEDENPYIRRENETYCKSKGFMPYFETRPDLDSILLALQTGTGYTIVDQWVRYKDEPIFTCTPIDMFHTVIEVWKSDNGNRALPLFLKTCIMNHPPPPHLNRWHSKDFLFLLYGRRQNPSSWGYSNICIHILNTLLLICFLLSPMYGKRTMAIGLYHFF
jgi:DNA-binding transcriptional LysR family regulator